MLKISKLTDYGTMIMTQMARTPGKLYSATEAASLCALPLPTVSKILKTLSQEGLLTSHRGIHGGYTLARKPENISIAEIVRVIEGPIHLTECCSDQSQCQHEFDCSTRPHWQKISLILKKALENVSLAEFCSRDTPIKETHSLVNADRILNLQTAGKQDV